MAYFGAQQARLSQDSDQAFPDAHQDSISCLALNGAVDVRAYVDYVD